MHQKTRLLVRADDAGSTWSSNMGCLRACTDGIARSVEVMIPGPWVTHAATLFANEPQIDIGLHLTLSSEWNTVRWRPFTQAPSLVDAEGFFLPLIRPRDGDHRLALAEADYDIGEILNEFKAQIETGLRLFPLASHISSHMIQHFKELDPRLGPAIADLCMRFGIADDSFGHGLPRFIGYPAHPRNGDSRVEAFCAAVSDLGEGDHIFIDHPAIASPELSETGHSGYRDVADDRIGCFQVLTSPVVRQRIEDLGIELIGYGDL